MRMNLHDTPFKQASWLVGSSTKFHLLSFAHAIFESSTVGEMYLWKHISLSAAASIINFHLCILCLPRGISLMECLLRKFHDVTTKSSQSLDCTAPNATEKFLPLYVDGGRVILDVVVISPGVCSIFLPMAS